MCYVFKNKKAIGLLVVMITWSLRLGSAVGADNTASVQKIHDGVRPVEIDDGIVEIDLAENSFRTLREVDILTGQFKLNNKLQSTTFKDKNGKKLKAVDIKLSHRVVVQGYQLDRNTVFAKSVQVMGQQIGTDHRTIKPVRGIKRQ